MLLTNSMYWSLYSKLLLFFFSLSSMLLLSKHLKVLWVLNKNVISSVSSSEPFFHLQVFTMHHLNALNARRFNFNQSLWLKVFPKFFFYGFRLKKFCLFLFNKEPLFSLLLVLIFLNWTILFWENIFHVLPSKM